MTERDDTRPSVEGKLDLCVGSAKMCALFLLRRTNQKCLLFVEGCSRMHFQENTSMSWVSARDACAQLNFSCVW